MESGSVAGEFSLLLMRCLVFCGEKSVKGTVLVENKYLLYVFMQLCIEQLLYRIKF